MKKTRKTLLVLLLIVVQSAIAISAGAGALYFLSQKSLPAGAYAGDISIGGMAYPEAAKLVENGYADKFKQDSITLKTENGAFKIPFAQIHAKVDGMATVSAFKSEKGISDIPALFNAWFGDTKPELKPVVKVNEGKLREALLGLADKLYIDPVDAQIVLKDGIIEKKAETNGVSLNVANAARTIMAQISEDPWKAVEFKRGANLELQNVLPEKRLKDYDEIQQVLAVYSTDIIDEELSDSIELAINCINDTVLSAANSSEASGFSFVDRMLAKDAEFQNDNEGYDQVASTLYAALLKAGVPADSITRLAHKLAPDYIEPGLDAWISGSACDLKFSNPFSHKLAIFARVNDGKVEVAIAGVVSDKKQDYDITTEVAQIFEPPVYNVENKSLKPGQKVVLNPGKDGMLVNVFINGELIGTDEYEAEKAIVQVGPGTNWKDSGK